MIDIALPGPFLTPLTYSMEATDSTQPSPVVGGRVWVQFRNQLKVGVVISLEAKINCEVSKIKPLHEVIDVQPIFNETEMAFLNWASRYYHEPIGNVIQTALPKRLRQGEAIEVAGLTAWTLSKAYQTGEITISKRAKKQIAIIEQLQQVGTAEAHFLNAQIPHWRAAMKRLIELGVVIETQQTCLPNPPKSSRPGYILNEQQKTAVEAVVKIQGFKAFLLDGITGSGKTEVYLGMIEAVIAQGKQVLVLVPEIGLTPQTVQRFEAYLQCSVAVMHSGLNDKERHCAWSLIKTNQVSVLLGTRSAIFTPFANLGLCIMDEEHDLSFKQQDGFRYSARDALVQRAFLTQVPVVLGTATPSFESLSNALNGRYEHLKLTQRAGTAQLPHVKLLDIRGEKMVEGVSAKLKQAMTEQLAADGQVLLFLNRRGFAPVLMCHECGWQAACPSCDANMTYHHQVNELRCHHCGYQQFAPKVCPSCQQTEFVKVGQGTERLEEVIQALFPEETILRIDRDTTRQKGQMQKLTEQAKAGEARILMGTQMLAKGHHFPNVTLVGLLEIDQGLFSADFRAAERMAQLVVQVSGRAGRAQKKGTVMIQTHHPEHPLLKTLIQSGYHAFALSALAQRKEADLPPFTHQILIRAEANDAYLGGQFLQEIKMQLGAVMPQLTLEKGLLQVMGPVSAPMFKRQGRYRYQLLLQSEQRGLLHTWLAQVEAHLYASKLSRKVRWSLDIDPQEMS